ncbi:putative auxin response factor 18-like isoform X1 [Capsicum annuum]|uniref:GATA transcription factor 11 n=1 Tax=Capsicum annuum TaxID=4072 RepID=UPI0007BEDA84|nr:GATA transcription factor 11 [Capsicum annuum]KAF3645707.1 putative auxin response factor 18-like isoform X1 [Capsicum annuum]KAF3665821.1 putative auxin response factor 18-like isoform X1 [Capsicum annuum]
MTMVEHGGYMDGSPNDPIVDDDFEDILNFLDFPMENLEEDGVGVEWDSSESKFLGPIPTEALMSFPPMPQGNVRSGRVNAVANSRPTIKFTEVQGTTGTFQTQSPVSVLEGSNSCSGGKSIPIKPIKHDTVIPVRPRSKRARPSAVNPWVLMAPISSTRVASKKICDAKKGKEKKRRLPILSGAKESTTCYVQQINDTVPQIPDVSKKKITSTQQSSFVKKCTHCEVTKTPQWREGPLGPKSLCNACGVRYRSGRLFPEYRPAASPTFVPSVHSNSHRKVVEMRKKSIYGGAVVEEPPKMIIGRKRKALPEPTIVDDPPMSPAPEFVPMSSYLFDVY